MGQVIPYGPGLERAGSRGVWREDYRGRWEPLEEFGLYRAAVERLEGLKQGRGVILV